MTFDNRLPYCVLLAGLAGGIWPQSQANAALSEEEASQLGIVGTPLTPLGAIRAGNAEGTIPEWTGGITRDKWPAGYKVGDWYVDPYADDQILFTITKENVKQYEKYLAPGQLALFETYPDTYKMHIYPTRRSASYPQKVYETTLKAARVADFCGQDLQGKRCLNNPVEGGGYPFPIPSDGMHILWNTSLQYVSDHLTAKNAYGFIVYEKGDYVVTSEQDYWEAPYWQLPEERPKIALFARDQPLGIPIFCARFAFKLPARKAGQVVATCQYTKDFVQNAYIYVPGQRRVRKAPEIGVYDNPGINSDGLRTNDMRRGFAPIGNEERYKYTVGPKTEMYVPYNIYKAAQPNVKFDDIIRPGHLNQDLIRYELHRVTEVKAELLPGSRHISPLRYVYFDEDTWISPIGVMHNAAGQVWRITESMNLNAYDVPVPWLWGDAHYDLVDRRYVTTNAWYNLGPDGEAEQVNFHNRFDPVDLTPAGLRRIGVR